MPAGHQHADDVRRRDVADPEEAERHQRRGDPRLDRRGRAASSTTAAPSRPSVWADVQPVLVAVDDRVDGEHQRGRDRDRAGDVEAAGRGRPVRRRQQPQRERVDRDPDRDVDEEDPVPAEQVGEDAAGEHAATPPPERTKPKTPIAFARSAGSVKRIMISESATAETTAPPRPCTARARDQQLLRGRRGRRRARRR